MLRLSDVIIDSTLHDPTPSVQAQKILQEFNKHVKVTCFTTSMVRGYWLNPNEFILGHRNKTPELAGFNSDKNIAIKWPNPVGIVCEYLSEPFNINKLFYGSCGHYVLNVPVGKYAKAKSGNQPLIFGPGPHVIHDSTFQFDERNGLVDQSLAYIQHETIHILRVPSGKIAKVTDGTTVHLLESQKDPFVFNSAQFKIDRNNDRELFFDATAELIVHGSIKRVMPKTGTVAISFNTGKLEIIEPGSKPIIINSATHEVIGFLTVGIQNLVFPSESTKLSRKKDFSKASEEELAYEVFTTKDSLKIGVKLFVAYKISNPLKALTQLKDKQGIESHIENLAVIDMGKAIQQCSSQDFSTFYQTKPFKTTTVASETTPQLAVLNGSQPVLHFQDIAKQNLAHDLDEYGIELVRLNIETPKILQREIAEEMGKQALLSAKTTAEVTVLEQQFNITTTKAKQEAETLAIKQGQINQAKLSQAQTELEAAKLSAEALLLRAEAEKKAADLRGKQFKEHPELFELEKLRLQMEAVAKAQFLPPQMNSLLMSPLISSGAGFFSQTPAQARIEAKPIEIQTIKQ